MKRADLTLTNDSIRGTASSGLALYSVCSTIAPKVIPLKREQLIFGRKIDGTRVDIPIEDSKMSRVHAELSRLASGVYLFVDHDSKNGSFHDGMPASGRPIGVGSVLRMGESVFIVGEQIALKRRGRRHILVGQSAAICELRELIDRVAESPLRILLVGESGTGKEVVATALHEHSKRSGNLVAINCAAIPENLMERELFGHKKGAFTGATTSSSGHVVAAQGGTLFLDEIGEMPIGVQAKLLRFVETGLYTPVGSITPKRANIRLIAATNRDLEQMVETGSFREDLVARLEEVVIQISPLRARKVDLGPLIAHFSDSNLAITGDAKEALALYGWPRNVRELATIIKRVPYLSSDGLLQLADLDQKLQRAITERVAAISTGENTPPSRSELEETLKTCSGNVSRVADQLGRDRKQIYRWLKRYELEPAKYR